MEEALQEIFDKCVKAIADAAYYSYRDGDGDSYDGCMAKVCISHDTCLTVMHDHKSGFSIETVHKTMNDTPNFDNAVIAYLEENVSPQEEWQEAYDNDDHNGDSTLDAGFGDWNDYIDYMFN